MTEALFRDKPSAMFFGFTHCPDVCPTTLMEMGGWIEALGADADKLRFVFVTVDPERDTPEVMNDYVTAFSDRIVGVTGEPEEVHAMVKDYKIFSRKVPLEGGDYTMDHTASMILLDANGSFVGTIARERGRARRRWPSCGGLWQDRPWARIRSTASTKAALLAAGAALLPRRRGLGLLRHRHLPGHRHGGPRLLLLTAGVPMSEHGAHAPRRGAGRARASRRAAAARATWCCAARSTVDGGAGDAGRRARSGRATTLDGRRSRRRATSRARR